MVKVQDQLISMAFVTYLYKHLSLSLNATSYIQGQIKK